MTCTHIAELTEIQLPNQPAVCAECVKVGGHWVHLRTCQTCGVTLCCNSSPAKHATAHFHASDHPVVASAEPGEQWVWCYVDEQMAGY